MNMTTDRNILRPENVCELLRELFWEEFVWSRLSFGWMPAASRYEWKNHLAYAGYIHTENMKHLEMRIRELPGQLNEKHGPPANVRSLSEAVGAAPSDVAFLCSRLSGLRRLYTRYDELRELLDPILEAPTLHRLKSILIEREPALEWLQDQLRHAYADNPAGFAMLQDWKRYVDDLLEGRPTIRPESCMNVAGPSPLNGANDPRFIPADRERISQLYASTEFSPLAETARQMVFVNATEIIAAESLTYLYCSVNGMPLAFYCDLARHIWDEARHSQMGVRRLLQFGYRIEDFRFFHPIELAEGQTIGKLVEDYDSLTQVVEACSFPSKKKTAEALWAFNDPLSAVQSEYDVADERLHVEFGTKWGEELHRRYCDEAVTSRQITDRARRNLLTQRQYTAEEIDELTRNAVSFCGAVGLSLRYDRYGS